MKPFCPKSSHCHPFFQLLQAGNREGLFDDMLQHVQMIRVSDADTVAENVGPSSDPIIHQTMEDILKSTQGKMFAKLSYYISYYKHITCYLENTMSLT